MKVFQDILAKYRPYLSPSSKSTRIAVLLFLFALTPLVVFSLQQRQDNRQRASNSPECEAAMSACFAQFCGNQSMEGCTNPDYFDCKKDACTVSPEPPQCTPGVIRSYCGTIADGCRGHNVNVIRNESCQEHTECADVNPSCGETVPIPTPTSVPSCVPNSVKGEYCETGGDKCPNRIVETIYNSDCSERYECTTRTCGNQPPAPTPTTGGGNGGGGGGGGGGGNQPTPTSIPSGTPPSNLSASILETKVLLTWIPSTGVYSNRDYSDSDHIQVYTNPNFTGTRILDGGVNGGNNRWEIPINRPDLDTNVFPGTTYYARVISFNAPCNCSTGTQTSFTIPTNNNPTPTVIVSPVPGNLQLRLDVLAHGIGSGGDNKKSPETQTPFATPHRLQRDVTVSFYNSANTLITTKTGRVDYDGTTGRFMGSLSLGSNFPSEAQFISISMKQYLRKRLLQAYSFSQKEITDVSVTLVTGDTNADNRIDILDYNQIMDCFSNIGPARACTTEKKLNTDLNDDGNVNQFDYNLFLREISVQNGD